MTRRLYTTAAAVVLTVGLAVPAAADDTKTHHDIGKRRMQEKMMPGGHMMKGGMMGHPMMGRMMKGHGATLRIETPNGMTFTCNAELSACLKAFEQIRTNLPGAGGAQ